MIDEDLSLEMDHDDVDDEDHDAEGGLASDDDGNETNRGLTWVCSSSYKPTKANRGQPNPKLASKVARKIAKIMYPAPAWLGISGGTRPYARAAWSIGRCFELHDGLCDVWVFL